MDSSNVACTCKGMSSLLVYIFSLFMSLLIEESKIGSNKTNLRTRLTVKAEEVWKFIDSEMHRDADVNDSALMR